jgi:hypothetical protein
MSCLDHKTTLNNFHENNNIYIFYLIAYIHEIKTKKKFLVFKMFTREYLLSLSEFFFFVPFLVQISRG